MRALLSALATALVIMPGLSGRVAAAQGRIEAIPLQCRLGGGPWRSCRMRIERVGEHWWLDLEDEVLEFRHDGRGVITVLRGGGGVQQVQGRWDQANASLCWDGICTLGPIPLD